jgi:hypothetical protein
VGEFNSVNSSSGADNVCNVRDTGTRSYNMSVTDDKCRDMIDHTSTQVQNLRTRLNENLIQTTEHTSSKLRTAIEKICQLSPPKKDEEPDKD